MTAPGGVGASIGRSGNGSGHQHTWDTSGSYVNFDPTAQPDQKTLVYSPQVRILVARGNKQYDVSQDITRGGIIRRENAPSSLAFSLSNKDGRYSKASFHRMDRVTVFMKRVKWIQVFSGYLDSVPYAQLYGGEVNYRATDTLKRLLHTWWDPALPASVSLLQQARMQVGVAGDGQGTMDSGLGSLIRRLLQEVGGWDATNIHIQNFPMEMLAFMQANMGQDEQLSDAAWERFVQLFLGAGDTSLGVGEAAARASGVSMGTYSLGQQFYVAEIIAAADAKGCGPVLADIQRAQDIQLAAEQGSSSFMEQSDQGWQNLQGVTQNWQTMARNSDGAILGVACAMAETNLRNLANLAVPDSVNFPNDGLGSDHDSIGLFQQRNNGAWGSTSQRMNPRAAAEMFFNKLSSFQWRNMDPGQAIFQVQVGGSAAYYSGFIAAATQLVQAARGNSVNTPVGIPSIGTPGGTISLGQMLPTTPAAVTSAVQGSAGNIPGAGGLGPATTSPGPALINGELAGVMGKPVPDAQGAVNWGVANAATVSYAYGGPGYPRIDCSQFTQLAYRAIGVEIPRTSGAQRDAAPIRNIPYSQSRPGDLMANGGHVQMIIAPGTIVSHGGPAGAPATIRPIGPDDIANYEIVRYADWGGPDPAAPFQNPQLAGPGVPAGAGGASTAGVLGGGTGGTGSTEPIARNLFTFQFLPGYFAPKINSLFSGERSLINCEPLIQAVQAVCRGSLRNFASAPNGDFVAYYPDYFGLHGTPAVLDLEDIEMKNVKIDFSDDNLTTHVYVAGADGLYTPTVSIGGWVRSRGTATVENEWLFKQMAKAAPGAAESMDGQTLMRTYGARPLMREYPEIQNGPMEKMVAINLFMEKWAEQYATQCEFTFMPELFPGMRINLVSHKLQVYVSQVEHSWDFENGFSTNATIMAPSTINTKSLIEDGSAGAPTPVDISDIVPPAEAF